MYTDYNAINKHSMMHLVCISDGKRYEGSFSYHDIDPVTLPRGTYLYHCRHDGANTLVSIEPKVINNFYGSLITTKPIKWPNDLLHCIDVEDAWFEHL